VFTSGFLVKIVCTNSSMYATSPAHFMLHGLMNRITFGKKLTLWSSSLWNFHHFSVISLCQSAGMNWVWTITDSTQADMWYLGMVAKQIMNRKRPQTLDTHTWPKECELSTKWSIRGTFNHLSQLTRLLKENCRLKGHLFTLGLVNDLTCERYCREYKTASCVLCNC
jgi:hypothetical protein